MAAPQVECPGCGAAMEVSGPASARVYKCPLLKADSTVAPATATHCPFGGTRFLKAALDTVRDLWQQQQQQQQQLLLQQQQQLTANQWRAQAASASAAPSTDAAPQSEPPSP